MTSARAVRPSASVSVWTGGEVPLRFRISALRAELTESSPVLLSELAQAWAPFLAPSVTPELLVECRWTSTASPGSWMPQLPEARMTGGGLTLEGEGYRAHMDAERRHVVLESPPHRFPLEAVLRVLLADRLMSHGGLLVHGVAVGWQGRAALFTGDSGAGKSTLGRLSQQAGLTLISDELVALLPRGPGYRVEGTPWNVGGPRDAELRLLGVLHHAPAAALHPCEVGELTRMLFRNMLLSDPSPQGRSQVFRIASKVVSAVPRTGRLSFALNPSVGDVLRSALAGEGMTPARLPSPTDS